MVRRVALFALLVALAPADAHAQAPRNFDLERFRPAPDRHGFLGIPGTRTPGPWNWSLSLWSGYSLEPLTLRRTDGSRISIVAHRIYGELVAELGITDRVALTLNAPAILWQDTDASPLGGRQPAASALRDPYVAARVRVVGEGTTDAQTRQDDAGIALQAATTVPIGNEHSFAGEGLPQLEAAVLADFHFFAFGVGAMLGYRHRFAEPSLLGVRFRNEVIFGLALESPLLFITDASVILEARVESAVDDGAFVDAATALEGELGIRWTRADFALTGMFGAGLTKGIGVPTFRGMLGLEWAPRDPNDGADECPDDGDVAADEHEHPPEDADESEGESSGS